MLTMPFKDISKKLDGDWCDVYDWLCIYIYFHEYMH